MDYLTNICHPLKSYQGSNRQSPDHAVFCDNCDLCPPHPADVPHLFSEANEHAQLDKSIKEFLEIARGVVPIARYICTKKEEPND